jgi:hypothetical protein
MNKTINAILNLFMVFQPVFGVHERVLSPARLSGILHHSIHNQASGMFSCCLSIAISLLTVQRAMKIVPIAAT